MNSEKQNEIFEMLCELGLELDHMDRQSAFISLGGINFELHEGCFSNKTQLIYSLVCRAYEAGLVDGRVRFQDSLKEILGIL